MRYRKSKIGKKYGIGKPHLAMNYIMRTAFKKYRRRRIKGWSY